MLNLYDLLISIHKEILIEINIGFENFFKGSSNNCLLENGVKLKLYDLIQMYPFLDEDISPEAYPVLHIDVVLNDINKGTTENERCIK